MTCYSLFLTIYFPKTLLIKQKPLYYNYVFVTIQGLYDNNLTYF